MMEEASHVTLLRRLIVQPQKVKDISLGVADWDWLVPYHSFLHLWSSPFVG
jgi:hypothetical protein